jgi:hypothetical protein
VVRVKLGAAAVNVHQRAQIISTLKASFGKRATAILFTPLHRHFAGGESFKDLAVMLNKLEQAGVGAILDYAAEGTRCVHGAQRRAEEGNLPDE